MYRRTTVSVLQTDLVLQLEGGSMKGQVEQDQVRFKVGIFWTYLSLRPMEAMSPMLYILGTHDKAQPIRGLRWEQDRLTRPPPCELSGQLVAEALEESGFRVTAMCC